jgi:hypothetical protein
VFTCGFAALLAQMAVASATPTVSEEAALARAIELTGQLDQRMLTTVYFCLGTLVTLFVVLIGYNWFTNYRSRVREMELLHQELRSSIDAKFKDSSANLAREIETIRNQVLSSTKSQVDAEIRSVKSTIATLQMESLAAQRDDWLRQNVPTNALRAQLGYLRLAHLHGGKWNLNQGFDRFEQILRTILQKDAVPPSADDIAAITEFLGEAGSDNPIIAASIKSQLEKIRSK